MSGFGALAIDCFSDALTDILSRDAREARLILVHGHIKCCMKASQAFSASAKVLNGEPPTLIAGLFR
jgi:hypothetical protein